MSATALQLRKALTTNSTATSFSAKAPTATEPSGAGVFDLLSSEVGLGGGTQVPRHILVIPFGGNADDETFDMMVWGWSKADGAIYIPQLLVDFSVVLGNISGTAIAANMLMADTITVNDGASDGPGRSVISPEENLAASALVHTRGCRYIEFVFDLTGTADAANAFWRAMDD